MNPKNDDLGSAVATSEPSSVPWSIKGVSRETRELITAAAVAERQPIGTWLNLHVGELLAAPVTIPGTALVPVASALHSAGASSDGSTSAVNTEELNALMTLVANVPDEAARRGLSRLAARALRKRLRQLIA